MNYQSVKTILLASICGLLCSIIFTTLHGRVFSKNFGVIKMDQVLSDHLKDFGTQNLTDQARKEMSLRFSEQLDLAIKEVSSDENVILLVSPAVVSNLPDYTELVHSKIEKALESHNQGN